jgi:hypothetical protein
MPSHAQLRLQHLQAFQHGFMFAMHMLLVQEGGLHAKREHALTPVN